MLEIDSRPRSPIGWLYQKTGERVAEHFPCVSQFSSLTLSPLRVSYQEET